MNCNNCTNYKPKIESDQELEAIKLLCNIFCMGRSCHDCAIIESPCGIDELNEAYDECPVRKIINI